jgi:cell wall assembly regulator SMI1
MASDTPKARRAKPRKASPKKPAKKAAKKPAKKPAKKAQTGGMDKVVAWLREHAPNDHAVRKLGTPGSEADIAVVAKALAVTLPTELVAMWRAHRDGIPILEYGGLSPRDALRRRRGLEGLRRDGTFDDHELFPQSEPRIQAVKWHTRWLPIAEDGGGNLWCLDFAPGPAGTAGQVIKWEMRGGAGTGASITLGELFERLAVALPQLVYDESSGTFDGPFIDLLA